MKRLSIMLAMLALPFSSLNVAAAPLEEIEQAYEVAELRVVMNEADRGYVVARRCDQCEDESLRVSTETRVFKGRKEVPLADILKYRGMPAVVFREQNSNRVTRIRIY